jgi:hypothetical protein
LLLVSDEEPYNLDEIFFDIDDADDRQARFRELSARLSTSQLGWLGLYIDKKVAERQADAQALIAAEVEVGQVYLHDEPHHFPTIHTRRLSHSRIAVHR